MRSSMRFKNMLMGYCIREGDDIRNANNIIRILKHDIIITFIDKDEIQVIHSCFKL